MLAYAKAEKGFAEIENRSFGLHPKLRRVLILIDGKRTLDSLKSMLGLDGLEKMLEDLIQQGFIRTIAAGDEVPPVADAGHTPDHAVAAQAPGDMLGDLPPTRSAAEVEKAKNFIINTLVHFHGQYTKLDLMRAVKACETHEQVRTHFADWQRCMRESRQAEKRLTELTGQLLAVL